MDDAKLLALARWRDSDQFDTRERLALEYAERMTDSNQDVDDEFYGRLLAAFDEATLVELTAIIGFENFSSKFNRSFRIEDQKLCALPVREASGEV